MTSSRSKRAVRARFPLPSWEGAAPFRPLGAVAVETLPGRPPGGVRPADPGDGDPGSPSGLLSRRTWEAELADLYGEMPGWYGSGSERERQFARWVQAEAKGLAMRLDRLAGAAADPALSRQVGAVAAALWADAEWARRRLDGSLEDGEGAE